MKRSRYTEEQIIGILKEQVTSRARPLKFIPKLTELACAEPTRRDEIANPRRALRSGARAG